MRAGESPCGASGGGEAADRRPGANARETVAGTAKRRRLWHDLVVIHRLHNPLPVNYLCQAALGACFAAGAVSGLLDGLVLSAVLANILLCVSGLALNNAVDVRTDQRHMDKGHLAGAVLRFGRARTLWLAGAELVCGLAIAAAVAAWSGRWLVAAAAAATALLHLLYNVEPVRLKGRGFAGPVVFGLATDTLACFVSYGAVRDDLDPALWPVFLGVGVLAVGRTIWWSAPDLAADTGSGVRTPVVRYGVPRTLLVACLVLLGGVLLLGWGLLWGYGAGWALLGVSMHVVFLASALTLARRAAGTATPSAVAMLNRGIPLVTAGGVILLGIPLLAG